MLKYLYSIDHNICLGSIDFSGLSSGSHITKELLEENSRIKKVLIETFTLSNEVFICNSEQLLSNTELLEKFNCRPSPVQRSK